jgi:NTP pyrophosphatase (non-canonical NTP hydrolase)
MKDSEQLFIEAFNWQRDENFEINKAHGFEEPDDFNFGEKVALTHGELSEALEWYRKGNPASDHISNFSGVEEEFADTIIRIMNISKRLNLRVAEAMLAKQKYNAARPYKHGGKKC